MVVIVIVNHKICPWNLLILLPLAADRGRTRLSVDMVSEPASYLARVDKLPKIQLLILFDNFRLPFGKQCVGLKT